MCNICEEFCTQHHALRAEEMDRCDRPTERPMKVKDGQSQVLQMIFTRILYGDDMMEEFLCCRPFWLASFGGKLANVAETLGQSVPTSTRMSSGPHHGLCHCVFLLKILQLIWASRVFGIAIQRESGRKRENTDSSPLNKPRTGKRKFLFG